MTGFCTTIDEISHHIRELVNRGIFARSEISDIAAHVCQRYGITRGTATWIARHVVAKQLASQALTPAATGGERFRNPITLAAES